VVRNEGSKERSNTRLRTRAERPVCSLQTFALVYVRLVYAVQFSNLTWELCVTWRARLKTQVFFVNGFMFNPLVKSPNSVHKLAQDIGLCGKVCGKLIAHAGQVLIP
jgi:hypothetical protein